MENTEKYSILHHLNQIEQNLAAIENEVQIQPASYHFADNFNKENAIHILKEYKKKDNFYSAIFSENNEHSIDLSKFDNPTLYFSLLWLKQYLSNKKINTLRIEYYLTNYRIDEYKNYTVLNNMYFQNTHYSTPYPLFHHSEIFVPETILMTDNENIFTVSMMYACLNRLLYDLRHFVCSEKTYYTYSQSNRLFHFFFGLKEMLLNKQVLQPKHDIVNLACNYISCVITSLNKEPEGSHITEQSSIMVILSDIEKNEYGKFCNPDRDELLYQKYLTYLQKMLRSTCSKGLSGQSRSFHPLNIT